MKYEALKDIADNIVLSTDMKHRIAENCKKRISDKTEENIMKNNKKYSFARKPAAIVAAIVICISITATALASTGVLQGFFRDVTKGGVVIGASYEQADNEIDVNVSVNGDILTAKISFTDSQKPPYSECEKLSVSDCEIIDVNGNVVAQAQSSDDAEIINGEAEVNISLSDIPSGSYKLIINAFTAEKKADAPLNISGCWECGFTK